MCSLILAVYSLSCSLSGTVDEQVRARSSSDDNCSSCQFCQLLPLLNMTKMTEWFPAKTDRAVIYASQYPVQLIYFNAETGEYADSSVQGWTALYGSKTLLGNLDLVWNEGKWGEFEGKLCDRISQAFVDKDWKSYDHLDYYVWATMPDHKGALINYYSHFEDTARIYPYLNLTISNYVSEYDQKLAKNPIVDLGFRFTWGLAGLDHVLSTDPPGILPHQTIPERYLVYAKSLGYGGGSLGVADPFIGCVHEAVGGAIPQYLFDQLPEGRYTPGKMISRYVYGYDSDMNELNLTIWLNGYDIAF